MNAHLPARRRRLLYVGAALVAISALVSVAILAAGNDEPPSPEQATSNFLELMALIPDRPETRFDLLMVDYDRLFSALGVSRSDADEMEGEDGGLATFVMDRFAQAHLSFPANNAGGPGYLFPLGPYALLKKQESDLGFSLTDSRGYVFAGRDTRGQLQPPGPPEFYEGVVGDFDGKRLLDKVSTCTECGLTAERRAYRGNEYYIWGEEDFRNHLRTRLSAPAFDELGRSHRLAVSPDYVLRTLWSEGMERMLDAASRHTPSLADDPGFGEVVHRLDQEQAFAAYISACTVSRARVAAWLEEADPAYRDEFARIWDVADGEAILKPYDVYAIASGFDGEPFTLLLLLHETPELARANVDRIRSRMETLAGGRSRLAAIYSDIEVTGEGRLLVARFRGGPVVLQSSPLLLHE